MSALKHQRVHMDINVVPFVDVMLVLLIVFMITVPLWVYDYRIALPKGRGHVASSQAKPLVISLDNKGVYYINHAKTSYLTVSDVLLKLTDMLRTSPGQSVTIEADRRVAYGHFVGLVSALESIGVSKVGLAIDPD
jgi:biopolymer transport protein TolR